MEKYRSDSWTPEEDTILAGKVLRAVSDGYTQLHAFEQACNTLGRTPGACGFRWNTTVRKQYRDALALAKQVAYQNKHQNKSEVMSTTPANTEYEPEVVKTDYSTSRVKSKTLGKEFSISSISEGEMEALYSALRATSYPILNSLKDAIKTALEE